MRLDNRSVCWYGAWLVLLFVLLGVLGCGEPEPDKVAVSPESLELAVGQTGDFSASLLSKDGEKIADAEISWRVKGDAGTISDDGKFSAQKPGDAEVIASADSLSASATVKVTPIPLASLEVKPPSPQGTIGGTLELTVTGKGAEDQAAGYHELTVSTPTENLALGAETLTLSPEGTATLSLTLPARPGKATVDLAAKDRKQSLAIEVLPRPIAELKVSPESSRALVGSRVPVQIQALDESGKPAGFNTVLLEPEDEAIQVSAKSLSLDKNGNGRFTVTLSPEPGNNSLGLKAKQDPPVTAELTIAGTPIAKLTISPQRERYAIGQELVFEATGHDEFGNSRAVKPDWSLPQPVATVNEDGTVKMEALGEGILFARYKDIRAAQPFSVVPGEPARLTIAPESLELTAGERADFTGKVFNPHGKPLAEPIQWEVEGDIGEISGEGGFFAKKSGQGRVVASCGDARAEAAVTVRHGKLREIAFALEKKVIPAGSEVALSAQGLDAFGNRFDIAPQWLLSSSLGTLDQEENRFMPLHTGTGEIIAKQGNVLKGVRIEVVPAELSRLEMAPQSVNLIAGETVEFTVKGYDRFDNPVSVKPEYSLSQSIGEMAPSGRLRVKTAGNAVVTATVADFEAKSTVAVAPAEMETARIIPEGPLELVAGDAQVLEVSGFDRFGNTVKSRVDWKLHPRLGEIDEKGVMHPQKAGKGSITAVITQTRTDKTLEVVTPFSVVPGETARIRIQPAEAEIVAGESVRFSAATYDRFDNRTEAEVSWRPRPPDVGTIESDGEFSGVRAGSGRVLAVHGNVEASAEVTVKPAKVAFLKIIPESIAVTAGEPVNLETIIEDRFGNTIPGQVLWQLSDDKLATVSEGVLTGQKAGTGQLIASYDHLVATAPLAVKPGPLHSIAIKPAAPEVAAGSALAFTAQGYDIGGNPVSAEYDWSISEPIGQMGDSGKLTAKQTGTAKVSAAAGEVSASVSVTVVPGPPAAVKLADDQFQLTAGESKPLSFEVFDAQQNRIPEPDYRWQVDDELGTVSSDNRFTAQKAGTGHVRLIAGDASARAAVTVVPGSIARVVVKPKSAVLKAGQEQTFSAAGFDSQDNRLDIAPVWSVDGGIGRIDEKGKFLATTVGEGFVLARMDSITGVAALAIEPGPVARIAVSPESLEMKAGDIARLSATAYDAFDNVTPADFTWSLSDDAASLGELSPDGVFQAQKAGTGRILASADGVSGEAPVAIQPGALARIVLSPRQLALRSGQQASIEAQGRDRFDNPMAIDPQLTVKPPALGALQDGRFQAIKAGSGEIIAQQGDITAAIAVTVQPGELERIAIQLPAEPLMAGKTYMMEAKGYDSGKNQVPLSVQWAVSQAVGTIDSQTGRFHAQKAGTGVLAAYSGDIRATQTITVEPGDLYKLFLDPNPVTVTADTVQAFEVSGFDVEENPVPLSESALQWDTVGGIGKMESPGAFRGTRMGKGKVVARTGDLLAESYVTVIPGKPALANCRVRVTHPTLPADGTAFSEVIVEVRDKYENPVPDIEVTLVSSRQADGMVQPGPTGENGVSRGRIRSDTPGQSVIRAVIDGDPFADTAQVTFE